MSPGQNMHQSPKGPRPIILLQVQFYFIFNNSKCGCLQHYRVTRKQYDVIIYNAIARYDQKKSIVISGWTSTKYMNILKTIYQENLQEACSYIEKVLYLCKRIYMAMHMYVKIQHISFLMYRSKGMKERFKFIKQMCCKEICQSWPKTCCFIIKYRCVRTLSLKT